jgi:hypothetical protein
VQSWKDLLFGLTKAGLVVNTEINASQAAVKQHSPHLQQLLDQGAQHLPVLLSTQGAAAQNIALTLLAFAYAGFTGDLGPVTQALASNLEGCLQDAVPQDCSNIVWALGKLCELRPQECLLDSHTAGHNQQLFSYLLRELCRQLGAATPQAISNAVYGCALAGHMEGMPQLLDSVCQQPQVMARADPQAWSNTLWAAAKLGCVQQGSVLLTKLAGQLHVLTQAGPQSWSNTMWAAATMYESAAGQDQQGVLARQLQHSGQLLMGAFLKHCKVFDKASPQQWSNTLWAAARLGCVEQGSALLMRLASNPQIMLKAIPQDWANTIWAAATLYQTAVDTSTSAVIGKLQKGGHLLLQACVSSSPTALQGAKSQEWANTLWAAAVLRWYDQRLFSQGTAALVAARHAEVQPQNISNALHACALVAHWDGNVQQLMGQLNEYNLAAFNAQNLANTLYAWAVLSCVLATSGAAQHRREVLSSAAEPLFKEAARRSTHSFGELELRQLYTAHVCAEHLGIPGLPTGALLEAAMQAGMTGSTTTSPWQKEVNSALRQMGYTTQPEMRSPDGLMSADIVITKVSGGKPCSIAVEYDGLYHYVTDNSSSTFPSSSSTTAPAVRLNGPTRLRNALLQGRFPDGVVCIPWWEWQEAKEAGQQQEYLSKALAVLKIKVRHIL